jgi:hypothetical protein
VQTCQVCIQAKADRASYPGKLQPLQIPSEAWHTISMDCVLVIVDKFTRYAHFLPLAHPYTASLVATTFMGSVYKFHGMSAAIVSNRDPVFTSMFW